MANEQRVLLSVRRDVLFAFAVEATAIASWIASYKLASDYWGESGFGAWAIARRLLSFILPFMTLGIEASLPRYIAFDHSVPPGRYLVAGSLLAALGIGGVSLLFILFPQEISLIVFGDAEFTDMVAPLLSLLVAYSVYVLCHAYRRGTFRFMEANALYLWAFGACPILAFHVAGSTPEETMMMMATLVIVPSALLVLCGLQKVTGHFRDGWIAARSIVGFGLSRTASLVGQMVLALLPSLLVAQSAGLAHAGAVALGLTFIGLGGTLGAPVSLVLLPATARNRGRGDMASLRRSARLIILGALPVAAVMLLASWLLAPFVSTFFLPTSAAITEQVIRIAGFGAGPFVYFVMCRSFLDAISRRALVLAATLVALVTFAVVWAMGTIATSIAPALVAMLAYVAAMWVLAITVWQLSRMVLSRAADEA